MYNIGQIPGCLFWGWYADRSGRKPALLIITLGMLYYVCLYIANGIVMILFGLCTNFYVAIGLRLLWGMLDGYLGICKTILTEVCSPDMLPVTTGLIFLSMALASTAGPIVGGFLSDPEKLLAPIIDHVPYLKRVPFAIPLGLSGFGSFLCRFRVLVGHRLSDVDVVGGRNVFKGRTRSQERDLRSDGEEDVGNPPKARESGEFGR